MARAFRPVICLLGPTASGKTEMALRLHDEGLFDIISVDSAMVYKGLNIGAAKPPPEVLAAAPHRLVDIVAPTVAYSVADFVRDASAAIDESHAADRVPLLVGGTMLYFRRLFDGLAILPGADAATRMRLDAEAANVGWPAMHARLAKIDPEAATRIAPADAQRIQRALEVFELTGRPISAWQRDPVTPPALDFCRVALMDDDRAALHARIGRRFDQMLDEGLLDEVRGLLAQPGMHAGLSSMRAVGYRQLARYLAGETSLAQAVADAKTATRRLAKRQFTWLRGMRALNVVNPLEDRAFSYISEVVRQFIEAGVQR